jgi:hypothetical protein
MELRPVATPGRVGQGTAVEQSRAIAEVQAQVIVAQQMPRDIPRATRDAMRSCAMKSLAEKAFYRYKRGGAQITGPTVQLARELARCFGNIQYGITELRRDDAYGQSEMLAFAWDLETNTRSATTFIVQHIRDTKDGSKALTDQRDIYELNANNGARRLREMIFAILPGWYTEDAVSACYATLAADESDGATAAERAAKAVARFGTIGVTAEQIVQKLGAPQARWAPSDLAQLAVIWKSIERRETTAEAEFGTPASRIAPDELAQPAADAKPARPRPAAKPQGATDAASGDTQTPPPAPEAAHTARMAQPGQVGVIRRRFAELGYTDSDDDRVSRLADTAKLARRTGDLLSTNDLTASEAATVRLELEKCRVAQDLVDLLGRIKRAAAQDGADGGN